MKKKKGSVNRFDRQIRCTDFGETGQKSLAKGRVLLVGMGGLGSWIAEILVRSGVGFIRICDDDQVDLTNLHRQALYTEKDAEEGKSKTDAAFTRLSDLNQDCDIDVFSERITRQNIARAAEGCDLIIDAVDNFETRYLINDFSVKTGMPWVSGGVFEGEGQVMVLIPGVTPCLQCILPLDSENTSGHVHTVPGSGVFGPTVSTIASLQAFEVIKYLAGKKEAISPYLTKIDFLKNTVQRIHLSSLRQVDRCPCCDKHQFQYLK